MCRANALSATSSNIGTTALFDNLEAMSSLRAKCRTNTAFAIPNRSAIGLGLFRTILNQVSAAKGVTVEDILRGL
jgi:hypothetical protein